MSEEGAYITFGDFTPCEIDDGTLSGHTPQEIFMAGVQWASAAASAQRQWPFSIYVYSWNADRVLSLLRNFKCEWKCAVAGELTLIHAQPVGFKTEGHNDSEPT